MLTRICLISNDEHISQVLPSLYQDLNAEVQVFGKATDGIDAIESGLFEIAIVDFDIIDGNGMELIKLIKSKFLYLPVLALLPARFNEKKAILEILRIGAFHYFVKPIPSFEELVLYNQKALDSYMLRKQCQIIVNEMAHYEDEAEEVDLVTGLSTYSSFMKKMKASTNKAHKSGNPISVIFLEIYKHNELYGAWGEKIFNEFLAHVGKIINKNLRATDIKSRVEKGLFAIGIEVGDIACALHVLEKMKKVITSMTYQVQEKEEQISINAGAASLAIDEKTDINDLIDCARNALKTAKEKGPNRIEYFPSRE